MILQPRWRQRSPRRTSFSPSVSAPSSSLLPPNTNTSDPHDPHTPSSSSQAEANCSNNNTHHTPHNTHTHTHTSQHHRQHHSITARAAAASFLPPFTLHWTHWTVSHLPQLPRTPSHPLPPTAHSHSFPPTLPTHSLPPTHSHPPTPTAASLFVAHSLTHSLTPHASTHCRAHTTQLTHARVKVDWSSIPPINHPALIIHHCQLTNCQPTNKQTNQHWHKMIPAGVGCTRACDAT